MAMITPVIAAVLMLLVVTRDGWTRSGWASLGLNRLVPGQATFALLMVSARRTTLRSRGSVTCRFRQAM